MPQATTTIRSVDEGLAAHPDVQQDERRRVSLDRELAIARNTRGELQMRRRQVLADVEESDARARADSLVEIDTEAQRVSARIELLEKAIADHAAASAQLRERIRREFADQRAREMEAKRTRLVEQMRPLLAQLQSLNAELIAATPAYTSTCIPLSSELLSRMLQQLGG